MMPIGYFMMEYFSDLSLLFKIRVLESMGGIKIIEYPGV